MRDELLHQMSAFVLADHIADDDFTAQAVTHCPDSTWQMFKHRHADSWWLRWLIQRRPVRLHTQISQVTVRVERYLLYPEANLALPELGRPVIAEKAQQIH